MAVFKQCKKCPWKVTTNPYEIPNGYSVEQHRALAETIAEPCAISQGLIKRMACHETTGGTTNFCAGWMAHQLGPGNNIALRIWAIDADPQLVLDGEQHKTFEDTLP